MRGKRHIATPVVVLAPQDEVLNFFTGGLKSHFTCSEKQLHENLALALRTTGGYFQVHLTTYPHIAVHVRGHVEKITEHKDWIETQIDDTLKNWHVHNAQNA